MTDALCHAPPGQGGGTVVLMLQPDGTYKPAQARGILHCVVACVAGCRRTWLESVLHVRVRACTSDCACALACPHPCGAAWRAGDAAPAHSTRHVVCVLALGLACMPCMPSSRPNLHTPCTQRGLIGLKLWGRRRRQALAAVTKLQCSQVQWLVCYDATTRAGGPPDASCSPTWRGVSAVLGAGGDDAPEPAAAVPAGSPGPRGRGVPWSPADGGGHDAGEWRRSGGEGWGLGKGRARSDWERQGGRGCSWLRGGPGRPGPFGPMTCWQAACGGSQPWRAPLAGPRG